MVNLRVPPSIVLAVGCFEKLSDFVAEIRRDLRKKHAACLVRRLRGVAPCFCLIGGRPFALEWRGTDVFAILYSWYLCPFRYEI